VHVPQARIEEPGAGPVGVRGARRVVAVVDRQRARGDHDERRPGVGMPPGGAVGAIVVVVTTVSVGFLAKSLKSADVSW